MLLVDDGRVGLDGPLERHLPEARFGDLTVRRLLAHSSGLQREPPGEVWESLEFPGGAELVARLADAELVLPAGERWHYSNLAYALLGELVTRVAGTPFPAFVDGRLLGRCRRRRTRAGCGATAPR